MVGKAAKAVTSRMSKRILAIIAILLLGFLLVEIARLFMLSRDVKGFSSFWQKEADREIPEGAFVYIALGDSTAQGIGASHPLKGYVGKVAAYIESETGRPVHVINLSVSGAKITDLIENQLPKLGKLPKAELLTISIGANNITNYDDTKFKQEFTSMVNAAPDGSIIANITSFKGGRRDDLKDRAKQASLEADAILATREDIIPVDLHTATNNQGLRDFAADIFHPSDRGYMNWADAFIKVIKLK